MFTINQLYLNDDYNDFMIGLRYKARIDEFDDFKQEVFLYMLEKGKEFFSLTEAKKIADKIAQRIKTRQMAEQTLTLNDNLDFEDDGESMLWEDRNII